MGTHLQTTSDDLLCHRFLCHVGFSWIVYVLFPFNRLVRRYPDSLGRNVHCTPLAPCGITLRQVHGRRFVGILPMCELLCGVWWCNCVSYIVVDRAKVDTRGDNYLAEEEHARTLVPALHAELGRLHTLFTSEQTSRIVQMFLFCVVHTLCSPPSTYEI